MKAARPALEKVFLAEAPILPPSRSRYPTVDHLPGTTFNSLLQRNSITFDSNENLRDDETLKKDFDQIQGETGKTKDGLNSKELPNGSKAIERPKVELPHEKKPPTLEIQSPTDANGKTGKLTVKVMYERWKTPLASGDYFFITKAEKPFKKHYVLTISRRNPYRVYQEETYSLGLEKYINPGTWSRACKFWNTEL